MGRGWVVVGVLLLAGCGEAEQAAAPAVTVVETVTETPSPAPTPTPSADPSPVPSAAPSEVGTRVTLDEAHAYAVDHGWQDGPEAFDETARVLCEGMATYGAAEWMMTGATLAGLTEEQAPILGAMAVYGCPSLADELAPDGHADLIG